PAPALPTAPALASSPSLTQNGPGRFPSRHGSIGPRCRSILPLIGRPADRLPIDRHVRALKAAIALALAALIALALLGYA
ncbi:MAG: hypothetical protein IBJ11_12470, partial [Phycisphaerales bacterium]|nr:hypothetical protein [Phycisphaerales bacterium]